MLSGEAVLIVEGQERPLKQWDFVHCPPQTRHAFVGAGDGTVAYARFAPSRPSRYRDGLLPG